MFVWSIYHQFGATKLNLRTEIWNLNNRKTRLSYKLLGQNFMTCKCNHYKMTADKNSGFFNLKVLVESEL